MMGDGGGYRGKVRERGKGRNKRGCFTGLFPKVDWPQEGGGRRAVKDVLDRMRQGRALRAAIILDLANFLLIRL
jgi:hypothetical protein